MIVPPARNWDPESVISLSDYPSIDECDEVRPATSLTSETAGNKRKLDASDDTESRKTKTKARTPDGIASCTERGAIERRFALCAHAISIRRTGDEQMPWVKVRARARARRRTVIVAAIEKALKKVGGREEIWSESEAEVDNMAGDEWER
jgi:hypothetical protein